MQTQPMQRREPSFTVVAASTLSLIASIITWFAVLMGGGHGVTRYTMLIAGALGVVCALLGLFVLPRGSGAAYTTAWFACGIFAGLGIPTLLSVGALFVVAIALALVAIAHTLSSTGDPWWHPRYMALGILAFALTTASFLV